MPAVPCRLRMCMCMRMRMCMFHAHVRVRLPCRAVCACAPDALRPHTCVYGGRPCIAGCIHVGGMVDDRRSVAFPEEYVDVNILGTCRLLDACAAPAPDQRPDHLCCEVRGRTC